VKTVGCLIHSQIRKAGLPFFEANMRNISLISIGAILLLFSSASSAQTVTRIKFVRGAVRANVSGTLNGPRGKRVYVIRVREGQTLKTEQVGDSPRRITIFVKDPSGNDVGDSDASCNSRREISPTEAGDYRIEVVECLKADPWRGRFTFRVTVR
jgi:hypothetical protein